jgi:hypothetical protein
MRAGALNGAARIAAGENVGFSGLDGMRTGTEKACKRASPTYGEFSVDCIAGDARAYAAIVRGGNPGF